MKNTDLIKTISVFFLFLFSIGTGYAQPGSVDLTFIPGGFIPQDGPNDFLYRTTIQPDGKILIGGAFTSFNGTSRNKIARLNADGTLDMSFDPGTGIDGTVRDIAVQSDGKIIIVGTFTLYDGISRNNIVRVNADGSIDPTFNPGSGANSQILACAIQTDGKILIGGWFFQYNDVDQSYFARINQDGSLDATFNSGTASNNWIYDISLQADGKILICGEFSSYNGTSRARVARINSDGTIDTSFNPATGPNNRVNNILQQPDGRILIAGNFTTYQGNSRPRVARLSSTGALDGSFTPGTGANIDVFDLTLQSDGKILLGGLFTNYNGTAINRLARINSNGALDGTFNIGTGSSAIVYSASVQSDGKIIVGGSFTSFSGAVINRLARLNPDGSLDALGANATINVTAIQTDGKILIAGNFTNYIGTSTTRLARLNTDGSYDGSFNSGLGANNTISAMLLQPDGKIIIAGNFTAYNGTTITRIARVNSDGTLDPTFNPGSGPNSSVSAVCLQSDGKIVISGNFTFFNGVGRTRIARLNTDGSLDLSFNPGTGLNGGSSSILQQADGKILIGGLFTLYNGTTINSMARLNLDGSLDLTFNPGVGTNNSLIAMALQSDGKIIIGGNFSQYDGLPANRLARINTNGTQDFTFDAGAGANLTIWSLILQADGKIVIGGHFTAYNGAVRNRIARVNSDGSLDQSFDTGIGASNWVYNVNLQSDGKIIAAGDFLVFGGMGRNRIVRLLESCGTISAPTGTSAQSFCNAATIANLTATGTGIQWYSVSTGGTVLPAGTILTNGTTYYASQSNGGCESVNRFAVTVTINTPAAPTGSAAQTFCNSATVANLVASGSNIQWYAASTGGTALSNGTALTNGTTYYASQTVSACESVNRLAVTATIITTSAPTGTPSQTFCNAATVANLTATGTGIQWYAASTGGTALAPGTALTNGTTYYASQTANGCESVNRFAVTTTINTPAVPTGTASQTVCNGAVVGDLSATGSNIQWYAAASGGSPLSAGTSLVNGTSYYASQTISGCESATRLAVTVTIGILNAPTGTAAQTFCNSATVANLVASGSNIQWYTASTGGTALAAGTALTNGSTYYASQTAGGCESTDRLAVTVTINAPAAPTGTANQEFCNAATVADLTATGSGIQWYTASTGGTALAAGTALSNGTYYASQTISGCESINRLEVTVAINVPSAPTGTTTQSFCGTTTLADITVTGANITWYNAASAGTVLGAGNALADGVTYYASQTVNGCESLNRLAVIATVNAIPAAPTASASQEFCNGATVADLTATGSGVQWFTAASGGTALTTSTALASGSYFAAQTVNGCESNDRTEVTVNIITPATPTGDAAQNFCSASTVADLTATGTAIQWYAQATAGTTLAAGTALSNGTYYASQTINGCESERLEVTVTVTILDATVTENGLTLTANQAGATYTWVDCNNGNQPIAGATAQTYTATANGSYAVIVELNGCSVTSNCVAITTVGLDDIKTELFRIYPNPASTVINVEMANASTVRMFDISGKLLKELNGSSNYTIDVTDLTPGMYMIESAEGAKAKFIKE